MEDLLTQERIRLDAWRSVFEKTNRIVSEKPVTVRVSDSAPSGYDKVPGWSDGEAITFNGPVVLDMLRSRDAVSAVLRLKGLNYHELSHVLFTPRDTDDLVKRIKAKQEAEGGMWWYAFNALEDQRIETMFSTMFGTSRRYFEATVLEWIVWEGTAQSALLLYGRKYLSSRIRVQVGRAFKKQHGKDVYDEVKDIIDQYICVTLPKDTNRAWALIMRYHDVLVKIKQSHNLPVLVIQDNGTSGDPQAPCQHGDASQGRQVVVAKRGAPMGKRQSSDVSEAVKKAVRDASKADAKAEQAKEAEIAENGAGATPIDKKPEGNVEAEAGGGEGDQQAAGGEGPSEGGMQAEGSSDTSTDGEGGLSDAAGGTGAGSEGTKADGEWTESQSTERSAEEEFRDLMDDAREHLEDLESDEGLMKDVQGTLDAVKAAEQNGRMNADGVAKNAGHRKSQPVEVTASRKVQNVLTRIRSEAEPENLRRQVSGRLDIRRYITRQNQEIDVFNQWDEGSEEETGVEAVLLMDTSGSAGSYIEMASAAVWALKRAFDRLDIRTTVMAFDTSYTVVYQPSEKARPSDVPLMRASGGTAPLGALQQANLILTKSQETNKVLITVTDGSWSINDEDEARVMRSIHRAGTTSLLLGMASAHQRFGKHRHNDGYDLESIDQLPLAAMKLVGSLMKQHAIRSH